MWPSPSGSNDKPAGVVLRRIADSKQENHKIENETNGKFNQNNIFSLHQTDIEKWLESDSIPESHENVQIRLEVCWRSEKLDWNVR